jgi:hypothetical protein
MSASRKLRVFLCHASQDKHLLRVSYISDSWPMTGWILGWTKKNHDEIE